MGTMTQTADILLIEDEYYHEIVQIIEILESRGLKVIWLSQINKIEGAILYGTGEPDSTDEIAVDSSQVRLVLSDTYLGQKAVFSGRDTVVAIAKASRADFDHHDVRALAPMIVSVSSYRDRWMMQNGAVLSLLKQSLPSVIYRGLQRDQCDSIYPDASTCMFVDLFNQIIFGERSGD